MIGTSVSALILLGLAIAVGVVGALWLSGLLYGDIVDAALRKDWVGLTGSAVILTLLLVVVASVVVMLA